MANAREETPAALALRHGHLTVLRLLLERGGEVRLPTLPAGAPGEAQQGHAGAWTAATAAAGILEVVPGSPCMQLANACRAWQLGFSAGLAHRSKPASLAALEEERQRYRLLLLALLGAQAGGPAGPDGALGSGNGPTVDGAPCCNSMNCAAAAACAQLRTLTTPASLVHAAAGSEALLDAMLAAGLSVGSVDPADGSFPLLIAARHGWQPMARLLARCADPNQADPRGTTPLMLLAARPALLETAQQLLRWHAERVAAAEAEGAAAAGTPGAPVPPAAAALQPTAGDYPLQPPPQQAAAQAAPPLARQQQQAAMQPAPHTHHQQQPPQQSVHPPSQRQPLLDLGRLDAGGRDAVGVALAAKNRRFAEELLAHLAVAGAPPSLRQEAASRAAAVAAKAYDLLAERGAKALGDINAPHGGQHLLLAQVGRCGACAGAW